MTNAPEGMIGKYRIIENLASGSQGSVHRARDPELKREVALKVLLPDRAAPEFVQRFECEAQLVASIDHPNVAKIFEIGEHGGLPVIVMEYVPHTLEHLVEKRRRLDAALAVSIARQAAAALEAARTRGITHHDIKPDNLLLTSLDADCEVKLIDFGIAHAAGMASMTQADSWTGPPLYMPTEQWNNERGDTRSDVYSLGIVMYQMLSGQLPFDSDAANSIVWQNDIMRKHMEATPASLRALREDVPEYLDALVAKCMAKDPEDRYQTPGELARALLGVLELSICQKIAQLPRK